MKAKLLKRLSGEGGFILVFVMLMIMLLMVFMTAMVTAVGYTNRATAEKSSEQQLQLTAQSAVVTLKDMFAKEENMVKLSGLVGKSQEYDLSSAGISDKIVASISECDQPGYVLLAVRAYDEGGNEYTTTTLLPITAAQGAKNDLIENMIVSYWPNANKGLTEELTYSDNVMNGSIIIDNEYYPGKDYYGDDGFARYDGEYGDKSAYKSFINGTSINDDPYAVKIKGGTFKELVTTGNLRLNAEQTITGMGNTTIASAVGQLGVTSGTVGDGTDGISQLGAGGYFEAKVGDNTDKTKKTGNILVNSSGGVEFKDKVNIFSRDRVNVNLNGIKGVLNNCFIGGKLTYKSNGDMTVAGDMQVYKEAAYNLTSGKMTVAGDVASGSKTTMKISGGSAEVGGAVATATGDLEITGNGSLKADYLLSGKSLKVSAPTTLSGSKGYSAFSGGNYGVGSTSYLSKEANDRGTTTVSNVTTGKPMVVNNSKGSVSIDTTNKEENAAAFKTMNSIWLSKAQKVYKGGWWSNGTKINFAVALLFDPSAVDSSVSSSFASYISHADSTEYKRDTSYITNESLRYKPENATADGGTKNWQWYEKSNEKYEGGRTLKVSHELGYTVNDGIFLLRSTLQKALGGPTDSTNLNINALAQGEFVDTARTAIPYDGAISEIKVAYPHYANMETTPTVNSMDAGYASVTEYKDGYLIGGFSNSSSTGYANFGRVEFRQDGGQLYTVDASGEHTYDINGKTLYFSSTSPILPGGWGDFYITGNTSTVKINNKIVVEYTLNGTDDEALSHLGYTRWFIDPSLKFEFGGDFEIVGHNNGSVDADNATFSYNGFNYKGISPEFYIFCAQPTQEAMENIRIVKAGFKGFIVAPWSVVDMRTAQAGKDNEVFKGVILCKNFVRADSGTYNHYKPISFGYAMSNSVFVLPETDGSVSES